MKNAQFDSPQARPNYFVYSQNHRNAETPIFCSGSPVPTVPELYKLYPSVVD